MGKVMLGTSAIAPSSIQIYEMTRMPAYIPVKIGYELDENDKLIESPDAEINYNCAPATDLGANVLSKAFGLGNVYVTEYDYYKKGNPYVKSANFSTLTQITGQAALYEAFYACENLESVDFSNLVTINADSAMGYAFQGRNAQSYDDGYGNTIVVPAEIPAFTSISFPKLKTIRGNSAMSSTFSNCSNLQVLNLSELEVIEGNYALFDICGGSHACVIPNLDKLTTLSGQYLFGYGHSADYVNYGSFIDCYFRTGTTFSLPNLTTISGIGCFQYGFAQYCPNLPNMTTFSLPKLTSITGNQGFYYCFYKNATALTTVDLPLLATLNGTYIFSHTFDKCTALTTLTFPSLSSITGTNALANMCQDCTNLQSLSFPALTTLSENTIFNDMLKNVTGCTVHFPASLAYTISNWSSVKNGFGGTSTTVLFDL